MYSVICTQHGLTIAPHKKRAVLRAALEKSKEQTIASDFACGL